MRLDELIENFVKKNYPRFGVNKINQTVRLLYEIAKREQIDFREVLPGNPFGNFIALKAFLLKRRYPDLKKESWSSIKLNSLSLNPHNEMCIQNQLNFSPKMIFIESDVKKSKLAVKVRDLFDESEICEIPSYREFIQDKKFQISDYNNRKDTLFIVKEEFDYIQPCPCSLNSVRCGYANFKLGTGCPFECSYCFLQSYTNSPGIVLPGNIDDFFNQFELSKKQWRLGSGQFTDSLVFDKITEFSPQIIDFFRKHTNSTFEFKTKSDNVDLLLETNPSGNIVVSWSLNPQKIIDAEEHYTAGLLERLIAARKCAQKGYYVGFHFDPIILHEGWEEAYAQVINTLFEYVPSKQIKWISLGCLRMTLNQKQVIESRFLKNQILDAELILDYDQKLRYSYSVRKNIFSFMRKQIQAHSSQINVYLCMESRILHEELGINMQPF